MSTETTEPEIIACVACPHCGTDQALTVDHLGTNQECAGCGGQYAAPVLPTGHAGKSLWGPREKPSLPESPQEQSAAEYLAALRYRTCFRSARGSLGICVGMPAIAASISAFSSGQRLGFQGLGLVAYWVVVTLVISMIAVGVYRLLSVILDIADALIDQGRRR